MTDFLALDELPVVSRNNIITEMGVSGLRWQGRHVNEEFLTVLQGMSAIRTYREMSDNDPVIGAIMYCIEMLTRSVSWRWEAAGTTPEDEKVKEFFEECWKDLSYTWPETITDILSSLRFGWSYHEIVYKVRRAATGSNYDDGKFGWDKFPIRSQDSLNGWVFAANGDLLGMRQLAPPDYIERIIPMEKALLFRPSAHKNNPEGRSLLRNAYRPWFYKKRIEEIEAVGIERDLAGMPAAFVPPDLMSENASPEEKALLASIKQLLRNVRRDQQEGIIFPMLYDENGRELFRFELISASGARQFDTSSVIERYDRRIAMTVLADFILLGHEKVGSFALSSDKTDLFGVALGVILDMIKDIINRFAVPKLCKLNGIPTDQAPSLEHGDIEAPPLLELAQYITALSGVNYPLWPNENLQNHLLEVAGLPMPTDDEKKQREEETILEREARISEQRGRIGDNEIPEREPVANGKVVPMKFGKFGKWRSRGMF